MADPQVKTLDELKCALQAKIKQLRLLADSLEDSICVLESIEESRPMASAYEGDRHSDSRKTRRGKVVVNQRSRDRVSVLAARFSEFERKNAEEEVDGLTVPEIRES